MAKRMGWWSVVVMIGLMMPGAALAGPYFGDWGWCWHPARDCPRRDYSPLHYWAPTWYQVRAQVHPVNFDQYPPGPNACIPATIDYNRYPCRAILPAPSAPYADPAAYYGMPLAPSGATLAK